MRRSQRRLVGVALAGVLLAACMASTAHAQGRGGGGPPGGPGGGGPGGGGGMSGGMGGPQFPGGGRRPGESGSGMPPQQVQRNPTSDSPMRVGLQFGPPGQRWWDDKGFAKSLKLRPDQQSKMDALFEQNRGALLSRFEGLHQAETQLEQLSNSPVPDESALFAQIDRVAQARADLEKANTHMLLQLRKEMDPDQIKRLENHR